MSTKVNAAVSRGIEILERAERENRPLTPDEQRRYDQAVQRAELETLSTMAGRPPAAAAAAPPAGTSTRFSTPAIHVAGRESYSLLRALRCAADRRPIDGFEAEVSQEIAKRTGKPPRGSFVPTNFNDPLGERAEFRDFNLTTGNDLKATIVDAANFIDLLRNRMLVRALGATILTGLVGDLSIPSLTGAATPYWIDSESGTVTASNQTTGQVALSPSTVGAQTVLSRKLLIQSTPDAEQLVRNDLAMVLALEIDRAAINGSGSGAEPEGILQNSSIATVAIADNGGAPTWAKIIELETTVAIENADIGSLAYMTNAKVRGKLRQIDKGTDTGNFLWDDRAAKPLNGYACGVTNQVPSDLTKASGSNLSAILFGNWQDLIIGLWSGLDVIADPYTGAASGALTITMLQDLDIAVRRVVSFAKIVDAVTS